MILVGRYVARLLGARLATLTPMNPTSWLNRLVEIAISVLLAALALSWAWQLLRPLVPVLAVAAGLMVVVPVRAPALAGLVGVTSNSAPCLPFGVVESSNGVNCR